MKLKICQKCGQLFSPTSGIQKYCNRDITKACTECGLEFTTQCNNKEADKCLTCDSYSTCKNCGNKFIMFTRKQIYCNQTKQQPCQICGKLYSYTCGSSIPQTCSSSCQAQLILKKRSESVSAEVRICKWCGKEFRPKEWRDAYCEGPHFKKCAICGKEFELNPAIDSTVMTCSKECMSKLMSQNHDYVKGSETYKQVCLEKYGTTSPLAVKEVREKGKQTTLERYGKEWYTQTDEYKEKVKQTDLERYGVEHHLQSGEVKDKRIRTLIEKYGTDNVFKAKEIKDRIKESNLAKYGTEFASQSEEIKERVTQSNLSKYGVKHPMMLPSYQNKAIQTNLAKYGRKAYTQQHIKNIQNWYKFISDPEGYICANYKDKPRTEEIASDLGVNYSTVDLYLHRSNARDCVRQSRSLMEDYFREFIKNLLPAAIIISNDKTAIRPLELDLYLPEYKFAIECNPTCTHNSSIADPWGGDPKSFRYHQQKTIACDEAGIQLFHVFGYEWEHKREIIESMIRNRLNKCDEIIYARKCKVVEVSGSDAMKFLNTNHRQGSAHSPIRLGLEYNGRLVSLMTFGKMRSTIGTGNDELDDCYELVRFCSLLNTSVVGGASKLFKYFVDKYNPVQIRSFSDRAHTSGHLYPMLGFTEIRKSSPGYVWVDVVTDVAYHRASAQKQNIKRFLKDDSIDLSKTESEIMIEHGFVQVFDSGTITWEWKA